jgi:hypothetical protein
MLLQTPSVSEAFPYIKVFSRDVAVHLLQFAQRQTSSCGSERTVRAWMDVSQEDADMVHKDGGLEAQVSGVQT